MRSILQDLRLAVRQLRHAPGFTLTAITVLTLGLGANIAVFTVLNGILLRPLPYAQPDRIATVAPAQSGNFYFSLNYANMLRLRDALGGRMGVGASFEESMASIVGPGGRIQVERTETDAAMLPLLGVQPRIGRFFRPEENAPGADRVALIGEDVWRKLYNSDPKIVGRTLTIKGEAYTILGVMPKGFSFPFGDKQQIWTPEELTAGNRTDLSGKDSGFPGTMYVRLPDGMTAEQLTAALDQAQVKLHQEAPHGNVPEHVQATPYRESLNHEVRKPLLLLYGVVFGIWMLACLNVTSLMLTRAVARMHEQSVRSALGASRMRLVQQSLVESLLLSGIGAVCGLALGQAAIKLLWRQILHKLPMTSAIHVDWRVLAGLVLLTLLTAAIAGLFPSLRALSTNVQSGLHGVTTTASASQNRTRELLVVAQIALTLVFLAGAGLFLRTIYALRHVPLGFTQQNVLTGGIILNAREHGEDNGQAGSANIVRTQYMPLLERLRAMPGVQGSALSSVLPLRREMEVTIMGSLDHKEMPHDQDHMALGRLASAGLTDALGIPMVKGRFFNESDGAASPVVVIVNQAFANKFLPGQDPIGHIYSMGKGRFAEARIVGVIGDTKQTNVIDATKPEIYFCLAQIEPGTPLYGVATAFIQVAIRAAVPADTLRAQFDKALHEVAPDATTINVETIHEAVEDSFGSQTLIAHLLEGFAALALMIASVGLYGLLSFAVAQRTREIGLRIALGAPQSSILNLVLRRAMLLIGMGLAIGGVMAWFAVTLARTYIFGVKAHDAVNLAAVGLVLVLAALAAAWLPARRAASIDPMRALRTE
ncbi:MAG: ABC transporter permease [Terracidiphilus sp.]